MDELANKLAAEKALNANLIRVAKERANAQNNISKKAPGYIVKKSSQYTEHYTIEDYGEDLRMFQLGGSGY